MNESETALASGDEPRVRAALEALAPQGGDLAAARAALGLARRLSPAAVSRLLARLAPALPRAARGDEALVHVLRALERAASSPDDLEALTDTGLARAVLLAGLGGAPAEALEAHPEDLARLEDLTLAPVSPGLAPEERLEALRAERRRHGLAVAGAELAGAITNAGAGLALSDAADSLLEGALGAAREIAARRAGPDALAVPFVVLALGKLGGRELNYSSDVDLVLLRGDGSRGDVAESVGRALVRALEEAPSGQRLYRTDLRLRPDGSVGALVPSLVAARAYYEKVGRTWERQALLKARPAAGDGALGRAFLQGIAPFLWAPLLDARAIDEIVALRARIEKKAGASEEDAARNVKEGPGGIRDIEYCVQFLQLLHGGQDSSLRETGTLAALERLAAATIVRPEEAAALRESYGFLRRTEHVLQLTRDRELKLVPQDVAARGRLARALGLDLAAFDARLLEERARARRTLDSLLRKPFARPPRGRPSEVQVALPAEPAAAPSDRSPRPDPAAAVERERAIRDLVLAPDADPPRARALLASLGFQDAEGALRSLGGLARERSPYLAPSGRARTLLAGLAPSLLGALSRAPDPDGALRNLERATATLGAKATFYELLLEAEDALVLFVALAAASDFLVETLARRPGVFDEVVDRLVTGEKLDRALITSEATAALDRSAASPGDSTAPASEALRDVRAVHLLLVGIRDVSGRANVQNTGRDLAILAEGILEAVLARARTLVAARHGGPPRDATGAPLPFAALALGKLGAKELSYSSDLDLLFVSEGEGESPDGTRASTFFEEAAREVERLAQGTASAEGPLYPIDLRLRPAGGKGQLAVALDAACRYYRGEGPGEHAADWERLALQKLRPAAGDRAFAERAATALLDALYARRYGPELRAEVVSMRARQAEAAGPSDLKRSPGGLADIEFLASALALEHARENAALRESNTPRLLGALRDAGLVSPAEHLDLTTAYQHLRRVELRLRVAGNKPESKLPHEPKERRALALRLGYVDAGASRAEEQLERETAYHRQRVRAIFERSLLSPPRGAPEPGA